MTNDTLSHQTILRFVMSVETKSLLQFKLTRKQQYDCVNNLIIPNILDKKHVFVTAPVKSGKRELVEIFAKFTDNSTVDEYTHFYICNLDRKDCKDQIVELEKYGIKTMIGKDIRKTLSEKLKVINQCLNNGHKLIFHIDESDFGSGYKQALYDLLINVYRKEDCHFVFYSATNEEVLFSDLKENGVEVSFVPDKTYCGYEFFLDNRLVENATQFFESVDKDLTLSAQAIDICSQHAQSKKQIGVVRLTTRENKEVPFYGRFKRDYLSQGPARKELEKIYAKYDKKLQIVFADKDNSFHWGSADTYPGVGTNLHSLSPDFCLLIIINQTSTRSTQWKCHNKIFFYHSYRKSTTNANTILQADARCVHYNTTGNYEDSKIKIYGDIDVFRYYSKRITAEQLLETGQKLSGRVTQSSSNKGNYKAKILIEGRDIELKKENNNSFYFDWIDPDGNTRHINKFNYVSRTGSNQNVRTDNLAYDILNDIYSLSESYENKNAAIVIDDLRKVDEKNTDWTDDWIKLLEKYPDIKTYHKKKKIFAVYVLDNDKVFTTNNSSAYQNI